MPKHKKIFFLLTVLFALECASSNLIAYCQIISNNPVDNIDVRIGRQNTRINRGVRQGLLPIGQANQLRANLKAIAAEATRARRQNHGLLSRPQYTKIDNDLRQNSENISNLLGSNQKVSQGSNALGPKWASGQDGAQDPRKLRSQMRVQEKRQVQQYEQAMQQVQEMHQQEYEKEMLKTLGQQRPQILQNKQDVEQIRRDSGAN